MKQDDFEAWTRQYWKAWGDSLRSATTPETPGMPGWNEAMNWWSQLAKGGMPQGDEAVSRFSSQAQGWFGQMQQLAAQFAGRGASPTDITAAWKKALGGDGANPFAQMFGTMPGSDSTDPYSSDPSQWFDQAAPWLQKMQRDGRSLLGLPAFGFAREHQERWQHLMQAQVDLQQQSQAYQTLLAEAGQDAFVRFERKLGERSAPGRQLESVRALFDLWIDAAEEAYADIALSPRFRDAYAALVNAQMTLRGRQQTIVEQASAQMGMPTRTELDSAHRKIVQLERELRHLRDAVQANAARGGRSEAPRQAAEPAPEAAPRPAPKVRKAAPASSAAKPARGAAKPSTRKR
jgi:class III poly(R)-hydroxyalkanoic acid synthase PhaE subunit